MNTLIVKSFAKLNLFLQILNKRPDNYHNIETLFERINLYDTITLKLRRDKLIRISCANPDLPRDETNFCYKGAKLLQEKYKVQKGADIKILKSIPIGAGLGGGSSNAGSVFLGLNRLWKVNLSLSRLVTLSKEVGCDVPFFIYNTSFAKGSNRGDRITPLEGLKDLRLWHILVVPKIKASTPLIYKKWDALPAARLPARQGRQEFSGLTTPAYDVNIIFSALRKKAFSLIPLLLYNSLEEVTASEYPQVRRIKEGLAGLGVKSILMSGSGPAVFGIVSSRKEAVRVSREIKKQEKSWRVFVARTV
ncbi:MAG: 4-(cytidine 5'-diphospho)-2-C-methyl-D-erythritol kinase [Candidatus Omnitrophota bacterium]